jgi:hypothetical protein
MKKEIVIASYSEDTSWIPDSWSPQTLIYSCGNPVTTIGDRFISEEYILKTKDRNSFSSFCTAGHATGFGQRSDPYLDMLKIIEIIKRMKNVVLDYEGNLPEEEKEEGIFVHKKNENNKNSLESNQWLTHIIQRYDALADVTVFLQGHPHDHITHTKKIGDYVFEDDFSFSTLPSGTIPCELHMKSVFDDATISFWNKLQPNWKNEVCWSIGAQFAASKKVIRSKPREWYIKVKEVASDHEFSAHALERTWWNVLGKPEITDVGIH